GRCIPSSPHHAVFIVYIPVGSHLKNLGLPKSDFIYRRRMFQRSADSIAKFVQDLASKRSIKIHRRIGSRIRSDSQQLLLGTQIKPRCIVLMQYVNAHPLGRSPYCLSHATLSGIRALVSEAEPINSAQDDRGPCPPDHHPFGSQTQIPCPYLLI